MKLDSNWIRTADINTVLDIGAHTGQFASAAHAVLPRARIYSFEPQADCYQQLTKRLARVQGFRAFNVALGTENCTTTFHRNAFTKSSSVLQMEALHRRAFPWTAESTPMTVEMRRLDGFWPDLELKPNVLVKIDVQGYEDRVLEGGERVIRAASYVLVETSFQSLYQGQASFEVVYDTLRDYGFRYAGSIDQLENPVDGSVLQADSLFLRMW